MRTTSATMAQATPSGRRRLVLLPVALLLGLLVTLLTAPSAMACGNPGEPACPTGGGGSGGGGTASTPTTHDTYVAPPSPSQPPVICDVYANGTGMGSYCVTLGAGGRTESLRERFGNQAFQKCRYRPVPDGIPVPKVGGGTDGGRYLMMICIENVDFDTADGGRDRIVSVTLVWVANGTDISDHHNGINDFLWSQIDNAGQMPVPMLVPRPSQVPVVGVPAFLTFRWLDPATQRVVAQGPYAGRAAGGPFLELREPNGIVMRAEATKIVVDPQQDGIRAATCAPDTPYREGVRPNGQPADACSITFPRSSASARKFATAPIPAEVKDAFYASVEVHWRVTYGRNGDMRELGNGFVMRLNQVIPVQEVQAPNQPPTSFF